MLFPVRPFFDSTLQDEHDATVSAHLDNDHIIGDSDITAAHPYNFHILLFLVKNAVKPRYFLFLLSS